MKNQTSLGALLRRYRLEAGLSQEALVAQANISARVASFLTSQGYRAFAIKGGYMAWLKAGYPIERKQATAAMPLEKLCPECGQPLAKHAADVHH